MSTIIVPSISDLPAAPDYAEDLERVLRRITPSEIFPGDDFWLPWVFIQEEGEVTLKMIYDFRSTVASVWDEEGGRSTVITTTGGDRIRYTAEQ